MSRDPDKEQLAGCMLAGVASLVVLAIPLAICIRDGSTTHVITTSSGLGRMFLTAYVASGIFTIFMVRRFGIPPAFGALGGFACGSAYWFMHIQQTIAKSIPETGQPTEYLDSTMYLVPLVWLILGAITSLLPLYKNKRLNRVDS